MRKFWTKVGCFLTGWNADILETCTEASRKQLKKYTSALLILMILWAFIGWSFAERYVGAEWWGCLLTSLVFVVIVVSIERQIILTVGKNRLLALFRTLIAVIMAVLGGTIIDQMIFKDDIEKKMVEIVEQQVDEQLPQRLTEINTRLQELQTEIDSLDGKNAVLRAEIARHPTVQSVSTNRNAVTQKLSDGSDTIVYVTNTIRQAIPNPKIKETEVNDRHLDELRKQQEVLNGLKLEARGNLRATLQEKQGFLEELQAVFLILKDSRIALVFYLILFFFLMFLELFVVFSKFKDTKSDYDLIIEHQLEQKKKMLDELVKEK